MDQNTKSPKRRNKFTGKEDVSRYTADSIISGQIDQLRDISRESNETAAKIRDSVGILYEKRIPLNTEKFEQLKREFTYEMQVQVKKVKQPSKGLIWYIVMWVITLASGWLGGYFAHDRQQWKERATYWYNEYQALTSPEK